MDFVYLFVLLTVFYGSKFNNYIQLNKLQIK